MYVILDHIITELNCIGQYHADHSLCHEAISNEDIDYKINWSMSFTSRNFNYLPHLSFEKYQQMQIYFHA